MQYNINICIILFIANLLLFSACKDYEYVDPCDSIAEFTIAIDEDCDFPCEVLVTQNITGNFTSFLWNFGDGTTVENENVVSHTYDSIGFFTITLTVFDELCDNAEINKPVSVGSTPPLASFVPSDTLCMLIRDDCTITFDNQSLAADTYQWFLNEELVGQDDVFSFTFTEPGTYDIRLEATNEFGTDSFNDQVIVRPLNFGYQLYNFDNTDSDDDELHGIGITENDTYLIMTGNQEEVRLSKVGVLGEELASFSRLPDLSTGIFARDFVKTSFGYVVTGQLSISGGNDLLVLFTDDVFSTSSTSAIPDDFVPNFTFPGSFKGFGVTESFDGSIVICGEHKVDDNEQAFVLKAVNDFPFPEPNGEPKLLEDLGTGAHARAISKTSSEYIVIVQAGTDVILVQLSETFGIEGSLIINDSGFRVAEVLVADDNEVYVLGNRSQVGELVKVTKNENNFDQSEKVIVEEMTLSGGLIDEDGELLLFGASRLNDMPVLAFINRDSPNEMIRKVYESELIDEGSADAIAELSSGGYVIAGSYKKGANKEQTFLLRTDENGSVDELE